MPKNRLNITFDPKLEKRAKDQAKKERRSFSAMLEVMAESYLEKKQT